MKRLSIHLKVTLWFTLLMVLLVFVLYGCSVGTGRNKEPDDGYGGRRMAGD